MTAHQWLRELQLSQAYDLILSGKAVKEVSYDVGFKQPSHFTKRFKARFGVPPSFLSSTTSNLISLLPPSPEQMTFWAAAASEPGELPELHSRNYVFPSPVLGSTLPAGESVFD